MAEAAERVPARTRRRDPAPERSAQRHEALERRPAAAAERGQARMLNGRSPGPRPAQRAGAANRTGLPDRLKASVEVNDDAGLEREADAMGERALAGPPASGAAQRRPIATNGAAVVQRAIGFEFETGNSVADAEAPETDLAKDKVYIDAGAGFHIDADTANKKGHNIEFVTDPKDSADDAAAIIDTVTAFAKTLKTGKISGGNWKGEYALSIDDNTWSATMQHTQGVMLGDMADFLKFTLEAAGEYGQHDAMTKLAARHDAGQLDAKVTGLAHLVMSYVRTLAAWDGSKNEEGPKNAGAIMSRTDFHSIYNSLTDTQKTSFYDQIDVDIAAEGFRYGDQLFKKPYLHHEQGKPKPKLETNKLTIGEWIDSVVGGRKDESDYDAKDLLSPPAGYDVFEPEYSMGAMAMDGERVLIEVRGHGNDTNLTIESWGTAPYIIWEEPEPEDEQEDEDENEDENEEAVKEQGK